MNKNELFSELIIRPATLKDIAAIQDIVQETWPAAYTAILGEEQVKYMTQNLYNTASLTEQMNSNHSFFLIFEKNIPIGFASFSPVFQDIYKLQKLYVLPARQKTGAGKALLQKVETAVKNQGGVKLQLNVNRRNIARNFYEKNGFVIIRHEDIDIGSGYFMNDYVMEKDL